MVIMPVYKCSRCRAGNLPLDQMKLAGYVLTNDGRYWASWCMKCHRENGRERARRMRRNPDGRRRLNAASRRYKRRRKADPALHAIDLENARIAARLRREKRGQGLERERSTPPRLGTPTDGLPTLPSAPLWAAIERHLDRNDLTAEDFAAISGVSARTLYRWQHEVGEARYDAVDKALMVLDLFPWDIWDEDVVEGLTAVR